MKMAAIYEGVLSVWPVAATGEPIGPPRRVTSESAHAPSWQGDSRHILYQSLDQLRIVDIESGETKTVPFNLTWTPAIPKTRVVVHAGKLLDMKSPTLRSNVDVIVTGNKITSVVPHAAANHLKAEVVDASDLTVMPGLTEFHSHLQKDYGAAQGRAWLAFGITTVRSPGNTPYEAVEDREANEAGVRPGPRVYGTGYLMEWNRVYYKMGIAISNVSQFEMELQRAKVLEHDLIKSYVRLPDLQQKRMVEFAHSIGVPVATHEIFPAAMVGVDNTEHTGGDEPSRLLAEAGDAADRVRRRRPVVRQEPAHLLPDDFRRRRARVVREGSGAEAGSALPAVSAVDSAPGRGAARNQSRGRRRRSARRQRQDGASTS